MGGFLTEVKCPQPMFPWPRDFPFGRHWFTDGFETILCVSSELPPVMGPELEWKWRENYSFRSRFSSPVRLV